MVNTDKVVIQLTLSRPYNMTDEQWAGYVRAKLERYIEDGKLDYSTRVSDLMESGFDVEHPHPSVMAL